MLHITTPYFTTINRRAMSTKTLIQSGKRTATLERDAVSVLVDRIDHNFAEAAQLILQCKGRVIITGMGKSGHIGHKIAATLASTGTPAFFVHPGEASHGDLGMIIRGDVVIAISNSGSAPEIITFLPLLKRLGVPLICMTGNTSSHLAKACDVHLDISVREEACPLALAPTSSTTVTLVMGDALAMALLEARGFTKEDFALSHPGGTLGRRLLLKVEDIMHADAEIPMVEPGTSLIDALAEISSKGLGMTTVVDQHCKLLGLFTDGDLRRALDSGLDVRTTTITSVMSENPATIERDLLAAQALQLMEANKITTLVITENNQPVGVVHMHDLLRAGLS